MAQTRPSPDLQGLETIRRLSKSSRPERAPIKVTTNQLDTTTWRRGQHGQGMTGRETCWNMKKHGETLGFAEFGGSRFIFYKSGASKINWERELLLVKRKQPSDSWDEHGTSWSLHVYNQSPDGVLHIQLSVPNNPKQSRNSTTNVQSWSQCLRIQSNVPHISIALKPVLSKTWCHSLVYTWLAKSLEIIFGNHLYTWGNIASPGIADDGLHWHHKGSCTEVKKWTTRSMLVKNL